MKQTFLTLLLALLLGLPGIEVFAHDGSVKVNGTEFFFNIVNGAAEITYKGDRPNQYPDRYTGSIAIPKQVSYKSKTYPVTSIGVSAFDYCSGLTSITIPNSVTNIGDYAFRRCSGLTSVTVLAETLPTLSSTAFVNITLGNITLNVLRCLYNEYKSTAPWNQFTNIKARHDVAVANDDSKTIFYNYVNNKTALEVTYQGSAPDEYDEYTGRLVIPSSVTYNGNDYPVTGIGSAAFSGCSGLTGLDCRNCRLTSLDVSGCTALLFLVCDDNNLATLDVSKNTALQSLSCRNNQLTALNLSNNTNLQSLDCRNNKLTSLDVSNLKDNTELNMLWCSGNNIRGEGMATLVNSLPKVTYGHFVVYNTDGTDGNRITTVQVAAAKAKGWSAKTSRGDDYAGVDPGIAIDATNFPDENFRAYVSSNCDTDKDTYLSDDEIAAVTEIYVYRKSISDLKGIEYFTALTTLQCYNNQLTSLDVSGCTALTELYCYSNQLTSLDVSKNTALTYLYCANNQLTSLDVSNNTALIRLDCYNNQLTTLDVTKNTALKYLYCYNNQLTTLDVSKNTALTDLRCNDNQLTSIDLPKNTALTYLYCANNQLTSLDVSNNTALRDLYCYDNQLTSLDVSKNTALTMLLCFNNQIQGAGMATLIENLPTVTYGEFRVYNTDGTDGNRITTVQVAAAKANGWSVKTSNGDDYPGVDPGIAIDEDNFPDENFRAYVSTNCDTDKDTYLSDEEIAAVKGIYVPEKSIASLKGIELFTELKRLECHNQPLTTLDLSNNTALTSLDCSNNQLEYLNLSGCTQLDIINCQNNQLSSLDVSGFTQLGQLHCQNNLLNSLNVSGCSKLVTLDCQNNKLTILKLSECAVMRIDCSYNQLTTLDLSGCPNISSITLNNNNIRGTGMSALVNSLKAKSGSFEVYNNDGTECNQMTTVQVQIAKDLNFSPCYLGGGLYPGIIIPGDANGDGEVNALDIACLRDYILGLDPKPFSFESANLNGDSTVDIADLTKLIQLLTE